MSFQRYPRYKDSGVEWLGKLPEQWAVAKIKWTTYLKARVGWKGLTSEEFRKHAFAYLVTGSDFRAKFVKWDECYQVEEARYEDDPFIQLKNGDLLITKDGTIGKLAIVSDLDRPACLNSGIFVARPRNTYTTAFMYWILSSNIFSVFCDLESFGSTINHLYQNVFERFTFPVPLKSEQNAIAEFLDQETRKIDELVAEQQRLMELLKEKRLAILSHAVTRGLNPTVPLSPSGIEWLGDLPNHWGTRTIAKASAKITNGYVGPTRDILVESGLPYIQATHIKNGGINFDGSYFVTEEWSEAHAKSILAEEDVLIVQTGAGTGDVGLVSKNEVGFNCHALIIVTPDQNLLRGAFLAAVLQSSYGRQKLNSIQTGAMHPHLNCGEVKFVEVPLPPINEQTDIVAYIKRTTDRSDALMAEVQKAINLLQERRAALISAAVTGQIDVRQNAAKEFVS